MLLRVSQIFLWAIVLVGLGLGGVPLRADVIYSNFGTGDAYAAGTGIIVTYDSQAWSSVAVAFVPASNYYFNSIELVATQLIPDASEIMIGLFADPNGQPGGAPIESWSLSGLGTFGDGVGVLSVTSRQDPLLTAGTTYWIGMNAPVGELVVWNQNITGALGFSRSDGSGNWSTSNLDQGVLEVDGTLAPLGPGSSDVATIPEPQTWWLMAAGLAFLVFRAQWTRLRPLWPPQREFCSRNGAAAAITSGDTKGRQTLV